MCLAPGKTTCRVRCTSCPDAPQLWRRKPRASLRTRTVDTGVRCCQQEHYINHIRLLPETLKPGRHVFAHTLAALELHWEDSLDLKQRKTEEDWTETCTQMQADISEAPCANATNREVQTGFLISKIIMDVWLLGRQGDSDMG